MYRESVWPETPPPTPGRWSDNEPVDSMKDNVSTSDKNAVRYVKCGLVYRQESVSP